MNTKIQIPLDKHLWHPSPLPGQIVLVTTLDSRGRANVAPKSWISMVAFGPPPILMFGCNLDHATAQNALSSGEFVVNVPGRDLTKTCWSLASDRPEDRSLRFNRHGLTPIASNKVTPPRIAECRAHMECTLEVSRGWDLEIAIFGRVESVSVDENCLAEDALKRYEVLDPIFFLEGGMCAGLGDVWSAEE